MKTLNYIMIIHSYGELVGAKNSLYILYSFVFTKGPKKRGFVDTMLIGARLEPINYHIKCWERISVGVPLVSL